MLRLIEAEADSQRADANRVRERVYCEEERMLESSAPSASRRSLGSETELLVYAGTEAVGTVRLRVVAPDAQASDPLGGLELASKFRLRGFEKPSVVVGEVGGFCILRPYRGTRVASLLFGALRCVSRRRSVTHWVAAANTETDSAEEAEIVYRLLHAKRLVSTAFHALAKSAEEHPRPRRFIYTPDERRRASRGDLQALQLPKVVALFAGKMGARYIGRPVYHRDFNVFATPLAVELSQLDRVGSGRAVAP
ncbi:MAG: GNAT family N-acetyltransferase [Myxococcales bacterium]|nr:MAG: GNAT family N-acetyltransferase [Myxococcales bacterium]